VTTDMFERPKFVQRDPAKRSGWRSGGQASQKSKKPFSNWRYQPCQCEMCGVTYPTAEYRFFCPICNFCRRCCGCHDKRPRATPTPSGGGS